MRRCCAGLSAALWLAACGAPEPDQRFRISDAAIRITPGAVHVRLEQDLRLPPEAIEALEHGVPLALDVALELRNADTLNLMRERNVQFIIRYLPLSQHYQLEIPGQGSIQTFPRLRHVIGAVNDHEHVLAGTPLSSGEYLVRGRIQLDRAALPGPMQLPAILSATWDLDSEWTNWPFSINA